MLRYARILAGLFLCMFVSGAYAQIQFEDVSAETGMSGGTESWGASWGDMNGDKWPDLFNQGHRDYPRFYRNTGDGKFEDVAYEKDTGAWIAKPHDDKHGASWVDFDNDGDQDLYVGVSATGPGQFLVNTNGVFTDRGATSGLANDSTARLPVWFDWNRDGHLDVAITTFNGVLMRRRTPNSGAFSFTSDNNGTGVSCPGHINYGQLIDLNHDGIFEFLCVQEGVFPYRVYNVATRPFTNVTSLIPTVGNVNNTIVADFDGDLRYDIVMTTGALRGSGAALAESTRIEAWLRKAPGPANQKGFTFSANGPVTFTVDHDEMSAYTPSIVLNLNSSGPNSGTAGPLSVSYNGGVWRVAMNTTSERQAYVTVRSQQTITDLQEFGLDNPELATSTQYLKTGGTPNLSLSFNTGLFEPVYCGSGVAGDFDNDMDMDLYLVCRRGAENLPNRLYENLGNGSFVRRTNHGGEGPVGAGRTIGTGESVVVADYDIDGFLDLYVTNGNLFAPWSVGGPDTLLRNKGNGNNWLLIDLQGTQSNRDGVGAKIYVTAGGVTQVREQNGGYHRWSQNHQRLHFGLANNATATVRIEWPSGSVNTFNNIAANALYDAVENGAMTPAVPGPPIHTVLQAGDECGEPPYHLDYGPAVLLWRNCPSNDWFLRAKGGRAKELLYTEGSIAADAPFSGVTPVSLSGTDFVDNGSPNDLVFSVGTWFTNDKGFNFNTTGQTQSCFKLGTQDIATLIVGGSKKRITKPFDLVSLGACVEPEPPPPAKIECGNPMIAPAVDNGVFLWRDCDHPGPAARWNLTVSPGGTAWTEHAGTIVSDVVLSATGVGLEAHDTLDSSPGDGVIDFRLFAGGNNTDGFQVDVPVGSQTCFTTTLLPPGVGVFVGADRVAKNQPFDMLTLGSCDGPPPPPPPGPECGAPTFNQTSERGLFLWRNCDAGPHQEWQVRITGGGGPFDEFSGSVLSTDSVLTATGFDLEPHDTLDSAPGDGFVDYRLLAGGSGIDGFGLIVPEGATACFDASILPTGTQVQLGADRQVVSTPFELTTLGACN